MYSEYYDCVACAQKHCDKNYKYPGSIGPASYPRWTIPGLIKSNTCLKPMVTPFSNYLLELYSMYDKGILLNGQSAKEQPSTYIEYMRIIESESGKIMKEKAENGNKTN